MNWIKHDDRGLSMEEIPCYLQGEKTIEIVEDDHTQNQAFLKPLKIN